MTARPLLLVAALLSSVAHAQEPRPLALGNPLSDTLGTASTRSFQLDLDAGQFVRVEANQQTVDLVLTVYGPDGGFVTMADATPRGPEPLTFSTRTAGAYRLVAAPFQGQAGRYTVALQRAEPIATTPEGRVDQTMSGFGPATPGAVVLVVRDGEVVFGKGYGMANLEYGVPNTPTTPFHVASLSKQFTGFAVAMLAEEGRLSLDDDVRTYVPEVPDFGPTITLRHLLHHTSGLRDQWDLWAMGGGLLNDVIRQDDVLRIVERQRELNFAPGTEFLYSNTGYTLLATVVERVTGESFADWMAGRVFRPLGMASTQVRDRYDAAVPGRASSYRAGEDGYTNAVLSFGSYGATDVVTTADDLGRWLHNFRTAADGAPGSVGRPAVVARMQERGVLASGDTLDYASGLFVDRQRGLRRLQHGGVDAGFMTIMAYYPEIDAGVVVLSNTATFYPTQAGFEIGAAFFGDAMGPPPAPWSGSWGTEREQGVPWEPSPADLEAYAGRYYSDELETTYTVVVEEGRLVARHRRLGDIALAPVADNRFQSSEWFFQNVAFERTGAGEVTGFRVSSERARSVFFGHVARPR